MTTATKVRIGWRDLPAHVRAAVEEMLGGPVVTAVSQPGGFSPGTADRVVTAAGDRAFVKAVSSTQNPYTPVMHRREGRISAALPAAAPTPRLLGVYDDGDWVALVLSDVPGRHPHTPWQPAELTAVVAALHELATMLTPCPVPDAPTAAERLGDDFAGWHRLAADPPADLDPWATAQLPQLQAAADRAVLAIAGDTLAHCDVRADNLLLRPDGSVVIVDWPHGCVAAPWLDTALLSINVRFHGGHDAADRLLADLTDRTGVDPRTVTEVLAAVTGYFLDRGRLPAPPGLPTVRAFQQAQGEAVLPWLRERLAAHG